MPKTKIQIRRPNRTVMGLSSKSGENGLYPGSLTPGIKGDHFAEQGTGLVWGNEQESETEREELGNLPGNPGKRERLEALNRKIQLRINEKVDELQEEMDKFNEEVRGHKYNEMQIDARILELTDKVIKLNRLYKRKNRLKYKGAITTKTSEELRIIGGVKKAIAKDSNDIFLSPGSTAMSSYVYFNELKDIETGRRISLSDSSAILHSNLSVDLQMSGNVMFRIIGAKSIPVGEVRLGETTLYFKTNQFTSQVFNFPDPAPVTPDAASITSLISPSNITGYGVDLVPNTFTTFVTGSIHMVFSLTYFNPLSIITRITASENKHID